MEAPEQPHMTQVLPMVSWRRGVVGEVDVLVGVGVGGGVDESEDGVGANSCEDEG